MTPTTTDVDTAGRILQGFAPPEEFLQFIRALDEADALLGDVTDLDHPCLPGVNDLSTIIYLLEKPWKYAREFAAWIEAGRPMDESEPGWETWLSQVGQ